MSKKEEGTFKQELPTVIKAKLSDEFADVIGEEHVRLMQDLAPREEYDIMLNGKSKTFRRRKILTKERLDLEIMRQKLTDSLTNNNTDYPILEDKLYRKMAELYLIDPSTGRGMTDKEFDLTEYEELKSILNACAFRTERPIPSPFGK